MSGDTENRLPGNDLAAAMLLREKLLDRKTPVEPDAMPALVTVLSAAENETKEKLSRLMSD